LELKGIATSEIAQLIHSLKAGARGYLLKGTLRQELLETIRAVHAGQRRLSPEVAAEFAEHATDDVLTLREIDVLRLIAKGNANKEIAGKLSVSEETVKSQVKNIFANWCKRPDSCRHHWAEARNYRFIVGYTTRKSDAKNAFLGISHFARTTQSWVFSATSVFNISRWVAQVRSFVALQPSAPFLIANPNPPQGLGLGVATTALQWNAPAGSAVQIRVGNAAGMLFAEGGSTGTATTGKWVANGMFYLQDIGDDKPLTSANTLAVLIVQVSN
jgi:hypothetical protein